MKSGRDSRLLNKKIILAAAGIVIITAAIVVSVLMWRRGEAEKAKVKKGVAYLEKLEQQDTSPISESIKAVKTEQGLNRADEDEGAVWDTFENGAILGDSRAVGFYYHEFVPEEQVMAESGGKITDVPQYYDQLKRLDPENIFLCFGLNDVGIGLWPEPADYAAEVDKQIQELLQEVPGSTVYLNSILPAVGVGLDADPDFARIGDYNAALKAMAEEKGYRYIDNTILAEEHQDLYQPDGLHVVPEFYKYWAANMMTEVEA